MKVYIYGDSHTAALHRGLTTSDQSSREELNLDIRIIPLGGGHLLPTPFFTEREGYVEITNSDYKKRVKRIPPLENPPDVIGLSMPLWPMRVLHSLVWNNYSLPNGLGGRKPISMAFFRNLVLEDQKFVLRLVDFLRRLNIPLLAIAPPGLFCDHGTIKRFGKEYPLSIFNAYQAEMRRQLLKRDVTVVDVPADCFDSSGLMMQEFRHPSPEDNHHANEAFGAIMIGEIVSHLSHT